MSLPSLFPLWNMSPGLFGLKFCATVNIVTHSELIENNYVSGMLTFISNSETTCAPKNWLKLFGSVGQRAIQGAWMWGCQIKQKTPSSVWISDQGRVIVWGTYFYLKKKKTRLLFIWDSDWAGHHNFVSYVWQPYTDPDLWSVLINNDCQRKFLSDEGFVSLKFRGE